jgi:hypothetical protein
MGGSPAELCGKSSGEEQTPERRIGELLGVAWRPDEPRTAYCVTGDTCQVVTGGGVPHELPEAERRRPALGGVPIVNWTWC